MEGTSFDIQVKLCLEMLRSVQHLVEQIAGIAGLACSIWWSKWRALQGWRTAFGGENGWHCRAGVQHLVEQMAGIAGLACSI